FLLVGTGYLHVLIVADDQWKTVARQIERQPEGRGHFVSFHFEDMDIPVIGGHRIVITTAELGQQVTRNEARTCMYRAVMALPFDRLRIATSTLWEKEGRKITKTGHWQRV